MGSGVNGLRRWKEVVWQPSPSVVQNLHTQSCFCESAQLCQNTLNAGLEWQNIAPMMYVYWTHLSLNTAGQYGLLWISMQDQILLAHKVLSCLRVLCRCSDSHASGWDLGPVHRMVLCLLCVWWVLLFYFNTFKVGLCNNKSSFF